MAMPDALSPIPEITDEDVEWVRALMGLDGIDAPRRAFLTSPSALDLSACPGSGKTTLIVANLAILARKWPHRTKGVCVLSHTNVAREEIRHRLSGTAVGQRLLGYPHFIDTIHGFVNRFLALPWLNSNGYPSPTIDNDVATAYRRGVLAPSWLFKGHDANLAVDIGGTNIRAGVVNLNLKGAADLSRRQSGRSSYGATPMRRSSSAMTQSMGSSQC